MTSDISQTADDERGILLPSPFILLGDMHAHNITWGNPDTNSKGDKLEKLISDYDLCLWNDGSPTYIHPATGTFSVIDISVCSPSLFWTLNGKFMMIYVEVTTFQHFYILPIDQIQQVFPDGIYRKRTGPNFAHCVNHN